MFAIR